MAAHGSTAAAFDAPGRMRELHSRATKLRVADSSDILQRGSWGEMYACLTHPEFEHIVDAVLHYEWETGTFRQDPPLDAALRIAFIVALAPERVFPVQMLPADEECHVRACYVCKMWSTVWQCAAQSDIAAFKRAVNDIVHNLPDFRDTVQLRTALQRGIVHTSAGAAAAAVDVCVRDMQEYIRLGSEPRARTLTRELYRLRTELALQIKLCDRGSTLHSFELPSIPMPVVKLGPFYPAESTWNERITPAHVDHETRLARRISHNNAAPDPSSAFAHNDAATERVRTILTECFWAILDTQLEQNICAPAVNVLCFLFREAVSIAVAMQIRTDTAAVLLQEPMQELVQQAYRGTINQELLQAAFERVDTVLRSTETALAVAEQQHEKQANAPYLRAVWQRVCACTRAAALASVRRTQGLRCHHQFVNPTHREDPSFFISDALWTWMREGHACAVQHGVLLPPSYATLSSTTHVILVMGILAQCSKGVSSLIYSEFPHQLRRDFDRLFMLHTSFERISTMMGVAKDILLHCRVPPSAVLQVFTETIEGCDLVSKSEFSGILHRIVAVADGSQDDMAYSDPKASAPSFRAPAAAAHAASLLHGTDSIFAGVEPARLPCSTDVRARAARSDADPA